MMHIADWYATFCSIAGVNPFDEVAADAGLPVIDSINMWPLISGQVTESPRTDVMISDHTYISGNFKLMTGLYQYAVWQAAIWPDSQTDEDTKSVQLDCKSKREGIEGCLFDLENDLSETYDLAEDMPDLLEELKVQFNTLLRGHPIYENDMIGEDACPDGASLTKKVGYGATELACGCWVAMHVYNMFDGPYQDLPDELIDFGFDPEAAHDHPKGGVDAVETADSSESETKVFSLKEESSEVTEEKDYSSRFDHPKVEVPGTPGKVDYSDRFDHFRVAELQALDLEEEFVDIGSVSRSDVSRNIMRQQKQIRYGNVYIVIVAITMLVLMLYAKRREKSKAVKSDEAKHKPASYGAIKV